MLSRVEKKENIQQFLELCKSRGFLFSFSFFFFSPWLVAQGHKYVYYFLLAHSLLRIIFLIYWEIPNKNLIFLKTSNFGDNYSCVDNQIVENNQIVVTKDLIVHLIFSPLLHLDYKWLRFVRRDFCPGHLCLETRFRSLSHEVSSN